MNLSKVYTGCTRDGKERLFYKSYSDFDVVSYTVYTDLKTKERFTITDIKTETLVPFGERVSKRKYAFKRKIKKVYQTNTRLMYHVDNLFLGDICKVSWISNSNISKYYPENSYPMDVNFCEGNLLFVQVSADEYKDLKTSKVYKVEGNSSLNIGDFCVNRLRNATKELDFLSGEIVSTNYALRKLYQEYGK